MIVLVHSRLWGIFNMIQNSLLDKVFTSVNVFLFIQFWIESIHRFNWNLTMEDKDGTVDTFIVDNLPCADNARLVPGHNVSCTFILF